MNDDRSAKVLIGGDEYELVLTTGATKAISKRYGGLEMLGESMLKGENVEKSLDEIVWLIALLANQGIMIGNLRGENRELLTEETVELLTTPASIALFKDAISEAMLKGTARNVVSEDDGSKNAPTE